MNKTKTQINEMISKLSNLRDEISDNSNYGKNIHKAVNAQVLVLNENLSSEEIKKRFHHETDAFTLCKAYEAYHWLNNHLTDEELLGSIEPGETQMEEIKKNKTASHTA